MLNRDINGRLVGQNGLSKDVKKVRSVFQDLAEKIHVGLWVADEDGRVIFWNPAMEKITGLCNDDALGRSIWEVHFELLSAELKTSDTLQALESRYRSFLSTGISGDANAETLVSVDGQFETEGTISALPTSKGFCLLGLLKSEVSSPVKEMLETSTDKFRNIVEQAGDGIIVLDAQEVVLEWNDGCEKISGIERKQALGMYLTDLMPTLFQGLDWKLSPDLSIHQQITRYLSLIARTGLPRVVEGALRHNSGR